MKKILALVLALSLCLSLAGCGLLDKLLETGGKTDSHTVTHCNTPGSLSYSMIGKLNLKADKLNIPMHLEACGRTTRDPNRRYLEIDVGAMMLKVHSQIYSEQLDGYLYTYTGTETDGETSWETSSQKMGETRLTMDQLPMFLQKLTQMKKLGRSKTQEGEPGDLYEGYIDAERIRETMDALLSMEDTQSARDAREQIDEMLRDMDPEVKIPVNIVMEGDRVLECYLNFMPMADKILEQGDEDVELTECFLRFNFWNYDSAQPIEIPAEARD